MQEINWVGFSNIQRYESGRAVIRLTATDETIAVVRVSEAIEPPYEMPVNIAILRLVGNYDVQDVICGGMAFYIYKFCFIYLDFKEFLNKVASINFTFNLSGVYKILLKISHLLET